MEVSDGGDSFESKTSEFDEKVPIMSSNVDLMENQFYDPCDASIRNKRICTQGKRGYDLNGGDFKTLEPSVRNKSNES